MKKILFISLCMLLAVKRANAQEQPTLKLQADKLYERYEYFKSLSLYLELAKNRKTDTKLFERIADCYRCLNRYEDAEEWYARVLADNRAAAISHYYYAEVLLRNQKFDLAKQQYRQYFGNAPDALKLKLSDCDSAALWMDRPSACKIKNETDLNTEYSDWGLNFEGPASLVFTSDRKTDDAGTDDRTGNNWFKLYQVTAGSKAKELYLATTGNDDSYHVGPAAFNSAADTAYITVTTGIAKSKLTIDKPGEKSLQKLYSRRLQILVAGKKNGIWTVLSSFPYNNVQKYSVGNAALSKDGHLIYFTSDMPGGEGKTDIWYCVKRADGSWGNPVNCGRTINTKEEEDFPTIGVDGSLYYSSKGLPGMGGFDIYQAKGQKTEWSIPQNLKYPINSTSDDLYLATRDGLSGYFSSNRKGGQGSDDIYSFARNLNDTLPAKPVARIAPPVVNAGKPVPPPRPIVLSTIYYDLDKANIRPDAAFELDKLAVLLKQHPGITIELSSFTDSRASDKYNLALSKRRAKAAVMYLVSKGIAATRLIAKYYGETNLVNKCANNVKCTEEEQQLNRRTEFKVAAGAYF